VKEDIVKQGHVLPSSLDKDSVIATSGIERGVQIFKKSRHNLKILCASKVT